MDSARVSEPSFRAWLGELQRSGAALQLREKQLEDRELLDVAKSIRKSFSGCLLINGRLDLMLLAGADGVHLTSTSAPSQRIRAYCNERLLVGVSTHSREEIDAAADAGLDYVLFGPVFATPSKADFGPPQGLQTLAQVTADARLPVIAVGGISSTNASQTISAGAHGFAAIRAFNDPAALTSQLPG